MQQASVELSDCWRSDADAVSHMKAAGYTLNRDWTWSLPHPQYKVTREELSAACYLMEAWGFEGIRFDESANLAPVPAPEHRSRRLPASTPQLDPWPCSPRQRSNVGMSVRLPFWAVVLACVVGIALSFAPFYGVNACSYNTPQNL